MQIPNDVLLEFFLRLLVWLNYQSAEGCANNGRRSLKAWDFPLSKSSLQKQFFQATGQTTEKNVINLTEVLF
uniref:Uncharacterized protein n=1 Tax=Ditylenchus dipsaci TaxID=166011 RepID=A0A915ES83_9BILA